MSFETTLGVKIDSRGAETGANAVVAALNKMSAGVDRVGSLVRGLAASFGAVFSAQALISNTRQTLEYAHALQEQARYLGLTVERLQEYQIMARDSGISAEKFGTALEKLRGNLAEAAAQNNPTDTTRVLRQLGLDPKQGAEDFDKFLLDLSGKMQRLSVADKFNVGKIFFGERMDEVIRVFDRGPEAIRRMAAEARASGQVLSGQVVDRAVQLNKEFDKLTNQIGTDLKEAFVNLAPVIKEIIGMVTGLSEFIKKITDKETWRSLNDVSGEEIERGIADLRRKRDAGYRNDLGQFIATPKITDRERVQLEMYETIRRYRSSPELMQRDRDAASAYLPPTQDVLDRVRPRGASTIRLGEINATIKAIQQLEAETRGLNALNDMTSRAPRSFGLDDASMRAFDEALKRQRVEMDLNSQAAEKQIDLTSRLGQAWATAFRRKGEADIALARSTQLLQDAKKAFDDTRTPLEEYTQKYQRLRELLEAGAINQDLFNRAVKNLNVDLMKANGSLQLMEGMIDRAADALTTLTFDGAQGFQNLRQTALDVIKDIYKELIKLALVNPLKNALFYGGTRNELPTLGSFLGGASGTNSGIGAAVGNSARESGGFFSWLGGLFGFASGGSFTVGGDGRTDSTPVTFMATRGEKVSVSTPGQQAAAEDGGGTKIYIDARGSNGDAAVEAAVERGIRRATPRIIDSSVQKVRDSRVRDPRFFGGRSK